MFLHNRNVPEECVSKNRIKEDIVSMEWKKIGSGSKKLIKIILKNVKIFDLSFLFI